MTTSFPLPRLRAMESKSTADFADDPFATEIRLMMSSGSGKRRDATVKMAGTKRRRVSLTCDAGLATRVMDSIVKLMRRALGFLMQGAAKDNSNKWLVVVVDMFGKAERS
ncbi:DUF397 domain-containing protein [Sesbania bispinosa]|nr:DUF397 domain-containing protein [Sesbania bispinosa]